MSISKAGKVYAVSVVCDCGGREKLFSKDGFSFTQKDVNVTQIQSINGTVYYPEDEL